MGVSHLTKPIYLSQHARLKLSARGCSEAEIEEAIRTEPRAAAELGRLECRKSYPFHDVWNGTHYEMKEVRPIFVGEHHRIVVVTVYTYFR